MDQYNKPLLWYAAALVGAAVLLGPLCVYAGLRFYAWRTGRRLRVLPDGFHQYVSLVQEVGSASMLPNYGDKTASARREFILVAPDASQYSNLFRLGVSKLPKNVFSKQSTSKKTIYGFFHPFANAGGGGERVLWAAVRQTLASSPDNVAAVYVGVQDGVTPRMILDNVRTRFGFEVEPSRIVFILLTQHRLCTPEAWPRFTLLGQAIGSAACAYEAMHQLVPDVWVDTAGYPFVYPLVRWVLGIPVCAYVHYPYVSADMLKKVTFLSPKWVYWRLLMLMYAWAGSHVTVAATNSSWTDAHMHALWWWPGPKASNMRVLYPPVAVQDFSEPDPSATRKPLIVYVAQFRAEKRHELVIRAFAQFHKNYKPASGEQRPQLVLVGSVRGDDDRKRIYGLRVLAKELQLSDRAVRFVLDAPWPEVRSTLTSALVGVNAMWNEHFGMGVVEYMAAGLIPVVHSSAGPKLDIVKDDEGAPGFFFVDESDPDYVTDKTGSAPTLDAALSAAFGLTLSQRHEYSLRAFRASQRFSDKAFAKGWADRLAVLSKASQAARHDRTRSPKIPN